MNSRWGARRLRALVIGLALAVLPVGVAAPAHAGTYATSADTDTGYTADSGTSATDGGDYATDGGDYATDGGDYATDGGDYATDGGGFTPGFRTN